MKRPVKVCCIQDIAEAKLAMKMGATALGLVSEMPSGWGPIPIETIGEIAATIPPFISSVLLTSKQTPEEVIEQQRIAGCNAIQIVDDFPHDGYQTLRHALPGITILQAVHVTGAEAIEHARKIAPLVHGLILDTGATHGPVRVLGGTGQTHDWNISAKIVEEVQVPIFLAGGLKAHNIGEAIQTTQPFGIDLCTGVRTEYRLDPEKLYDFFAAVNATEN